MFQSTGLERGVFWKPWVSRVAFIQVIFSLCRTLCWKNNLVCFSFLLFTLLKRVKIYIYLVKHIFQMQSPFNIDIYFLFNKKISAILGAFHMHFRQLFLLSLITAFFTNMGADKELWPVDHNLSFNEYGKCQSLKLGSFVNEWGSSQMDVPDRVFL